MQAPASALPWHQGNRRTGKDLPYAYDVNDVVKIAGTYQRRILWQVMLAVSGVCLAIKNNEYKGYYGRCMLAVSGVCLTIRPLHSIQCTEGRSSYCWSVN